MLFFGQFLNKIYFFIIISLLIVNVNGAYLKANPAKIEMNGIINEKICKEIKINSDREEIISVIKWNKDNKSIFLDYFESEDLGIIDNLENKININKEYLKDFCFSFKYPGDYSGIIFFNINGAPVGIGIKVFANISGEILDHEKMILTGYSVNIPEYESENKNNFYYFIPTILLILILIILIFILKRKSRE